MKYSLVFAKNRHWWAILSKLIMKLEEVPFSHSAIMVDDVIYDSVLGGSRKIKFCDWLNDYQPVVIVNMESDKDPIPVLEELIRHDYSMVQLLLMPVWKFSHGLWRSLRKIYPYDDCEYVICSELAGRAVCSLSNIKIDGDPDTWGLKTILNAVKPEVLNEQ